MEEGRPLFTYVLFIFLLFIQLYLAILPLEEAMRLYEVYSLTPVKLVRGLNPESLVVHMFLHGSWLHLALNSIALLGAGGIVERELGALRCAAIYLSSGIVSGLVHALFNPGSEMPLVGASGAIFGLIAVLFLLMPFKITCVLFIPLPAFIVGVILSAAEFSSLWLGIKGPVAHDVHVTGLVYGSLCAFLIDSKRALRGLLVAVATLILIYLLGLRLGLLALPH
jgi:membrane associated rhomboid family serine protease